MDITGKTAIVTGAVGIGYGIVYRLAEAGATVPEIAAITGHGLADVAEILDANYLSHTNALADSGIRKLERKESRTKPVNRM